jgi:hypothetical protein
MPLFILGFVFVVGLFVYYFFSTSSGKSDDEPPKKKKDDGLKKEENVIFLPDDVNEIKKNHKIKH